MNPRALSEALVENIQKFSNKVMSLKSHADIAKKLGMEIDEMNKACQTGKRAAEEFVSMLEKFEIDNLKKKVVPLQGIYWVEWGRLDKEESRHTFRGNEHPQVYSSNLNEEKKKLRKMQQTNGPSSEIKFFLEKLQSFTDPKVKKYFVHWCQTSLNEMSERYLPDILKEFNQCVKELSKLNSKAESLRKTEQVNLEQENEEHIKAERMKIKQLSEKFSASTFGIEHVFREIGQIYESYEKENCEKINKSNKYEDCKETVSNLPKVMADLFNMGFPLEIMDGDASHVPLTWIKQVIDEVMKKIGNVNVFVLSILGIQSCGKSTLINTMFGSKFAVASGRCTKGVFIQLLPVASNMRNKIGCDYFIIMDSEGLRSPELADSVKHDNEIATLIACLANTTVINFWGQTFSKDMSDIMQIVSYAYIRMKQVEIKSSFHIIFADVTAEEKNRLGVKKILDELNNMILRAAEEEGKAEMFKGLSSIFPLIQEQLDTVHAPEFLPTLWQGSMNPPETRYGDILRQLKNAICIGLIEQQNNGKETLRVQPITEFCKRFLAIWNAIKKENFVFSFKNSRAIEAFSEVQKFYDKELTRLRNTFFQHSYKVTKECVAEFSEITDKKKSLKSFDKKMFEYIKPHQEDVVSNLRNYISKMQDSELVAHHLENFCNSMEKSTIDWTEKEKSKLKERIGTVQKSKEKLNEYKKHILLEAREMAATIRDNKNTPINEIVVNKSFENLFNKWQAEAQVEDKKVKKSFTDLFEEIHSNSVGILNQKLTLLKPKNNVHRNDKITESLEKFKHCAENEPFSFNIQNQQVIIEKIKSYFCYRNSESVQLKINDLIELIKDKISTCETASEYSYTTVIGEIIESVYDETMSPNSNCLSNKKHKKDFLIQIYGYSVKQLANIQANYLSKCSWSNFLLTQREQLLKKFKSECLNAHHDTRTAARFIKNILRPILVEQIKLTAGSTVFDAITSQSQLREKKTMIFHILKDLLYQPFINVHKFIDNYKIYVKSYIANKVTQLCIDEQLLQICLIKKIKSNILSVADAFAKIQEEKNIKSMSAIFWWREVDEKLKILKFDYQFLFKDVHGELRDATDLSFVTTEIIKKIKANEFERTVFKDVVRAATEQNIEKMNDAVCIKKMLEWFVVNPLTALNEQRIGCTAQCPFCGAVCAGESECENNGSIIQKHRTYIHMPQGINGYRWVSDISEFFFNLIVKNKENCLVSDICSSVMLSNCYFKMTQENKKKYNITHDNWIPYSEVNTLLYDWNIESLLQSSATEFWQYLFVKYQNEFAKYYGAKKAKDIPIGWKTVSEQDALRNLREMYGVQEE